MFHDLTNELKEDRLRYLIEDFDERENRGLIVEA